MLSSTIVMIYFKMKNRTYESNPLFIAKLEIEGHIKKRHRGIVLCLCLKSAINWVSIHVEWREVEQLTVRSEGCPWRFLLQFFFTWCLVLKKVPGILLHREPNRAARTWYTMLLYLEFVKFSFTRNLLASALHFFLWSLAGTLVARNKYSVC